MMKKLTIALALAVMALAGAAVDRVIVTKQPTAVAAPQRAPAPAAVAAAPSAPAPGAALVDDPKAVYRVPVDGSPARGPSDALVTIVESSDFECPFCKRAAPTMKQIEAAYPGRVRFVFKHNPLSMHRSAVPAAMLAEEARAQQGDAKFWAVHDALLAAPSLDALVLEKISREAGLSAAPVKTAIDGSKHMERLRQDQTLVNALGASGTPSFFVNGRKIVGAQSFEAFKAVIDEELAKAEALVKGGVAPRDVYARTIEKGATAPVRIAAPAPAAAPAAPSAQAAKVTVRPDDVVHGPAVAPVTIVLFSDFQCPFCGRVEPTLKQIDQAYPGKVRFAWKHQPLPFHPNAMPAAKAAEAARAQGKFWEMHDKLMANQQALSDTAYSQYAKELRLDAARFQRDVAGDAGGKRIAEDQKLAAEVGATGTPTLFVNCRKVVGAQPFEAFKAVIEEELKKADGKTVDAGFYDRTCAANVAAGPAVVAAAPRDVAIRKDDPARGGSRAAVTVVEFSDFQCPFCSRAVQPVKELESAFGSDVRVVWKHLPLSFHPNAMPAAIAAEAARQQGKFWEMHDKLFANQQALSEAAYVQYAKELKLDLARFQATLKDPATRKRVDEDAAAAGAAGVTGTPTFVVNGEVVVGSNALRPAVERQLEKARLARR